MKENSAPQNAKTVLLVDDNSEFRKLIANILTSRYDLTVEEAPNGQEALKLYHSLLAAGHPPDLICTDGIMPGMNGCDLIKAIKQECTDASRTAPHFVYMSSHDDYKIAAETVGEKNHALPINGSPQPIINEIVTQLGMEYIPLKTGEFKRLPTGSYPKPDGSSFNR